MVKVLIISNQLFFLIKADIMPIQKWYNMSLYLNYAQRYDIERKKIMMMIKELCVTLEPVD